MDWLSGMTGLVKLPAKYYAIVALTTGAMLFLPSTILKRLNLDSIPAPYGSVVGVAFVVSSVFLLVNFGSWCVKWVQWRIKAGERIERIRNKMSSLDGAEQAILREFFLVGQTTIRLPLDNPVVAGLVAEGVIRQVGPTGRLSLHGPLFSFRMSDDALVLADDETFGVPPQAAQREQDGRLAFNDIGAQWLEENRPSFVDDVERVDRARRRW